MAPPTFSWHDLIPNHLPTTVLHRGIQAYERKAFPNGDYFGVHVGGYLGSGQFFEVTVPKPRIGDTSELDTLIAQGWRIEVYRPRGYDWVFSDEAMLREIINRKDEHGKSMLDHAYAYEDYVPFVLEVLIGYLPGTFKFITNVLGSRWKNWIFLLARLDQSDWVCSTGWTSVLAAAHKDRPEIPRPFKEPDGTPMFIERVTPAHFANSPADFIKLS
jgi:hypothetical protein